MICFPAVCRAGRRTYAQRYVFQLTFGTAITIKRSVALLETAGQFRLTPWPGPGGVPEWLKGTDCKSVGYAYAGSNPAPSTSSDVGRDLSRVRV